MKRSILITLVCIPIFVTGQKVGIGTTTPAFRLDVKTGSINTDSLYRIGGISILAAKGNGNLHVGQHAGPVNTADYNSFLGFEAGLSNLAGSFNTFTGYQAGRQNQGGLTNSFFGFQAGRNNLGGDRNSAFGASAGYAVVGGSDNSFFGAGAGFSTTSSFNTFLGANAGRLTSTGGSNTFLGSAAGYSTTAGDFNAFVGRNAGYANNGYENVFVGSGTGYNNSGSYNTFVGKDAGRSTGSAYDNVFVGHQAGYNTNGDYNVFLGSGAGFYNTAGKSNTFIGFWAGLENVNGVSNIAIGKQALRFNEFGDRNIAIGDSALFFQDSGLGYNTAVGHNSGFLTTSGELNTWVGGYAGYYNTSGSANVSLGYYAGLSIENANLCTYIGQNANATNDFPNSTGLGANVVVTAANQVRIGNSTMSSIGGYAGWSNLSDSRFKTDVNENVSGLPFILKLRPVTYHLDMQSLQQKLHPGKLPKTSDEDAVSQKAAIQYTGFIAQEVEAAAKSVGFDFSGVDAPKNENDFYALRYAEFVVPLVKAVQELNVIVEEQSEKIQELKARIISLENPR